MLERKVREMRPSITNISLISMEDAPKPMLTLLFRGKSHKIPLEGTQANLQALIQSATDVPPSQQTILYKGRKLTLILDAPVEDLNLVQKAMLLRKPTKNAIEAIDREIVTAPLRQIQKSLVTFESQLKTIQEAITRHTKGFLDKDMTNEALENDSKEVRIVEEGVMKIVEEVDGMPVPDEGADVWRVERRAIVRKAQAILVVADGLHGNIRQLREDQWGEVESRRGKG